MSSTARTFADSDGATIDRSKCEISRILSNRTGRGNSISSKELAKRVGLKPTTVRDLIPEIRKEDKLPVVSGSRGYFVVESDEEFREYMDRVERTIETKRENQKELARAYYSRE